ncbi:MAG: hypothetical protein CVV18_04690 [Gammaproteobacteria bacterium HGW-Gammaproteobacteria-8]|nr:MAG: hypothetical protein CVV18_04690 [Gammaproteobacteria bacterium HGW-Gammaproteobacteria-8]
MVIWTDPAKADLRSIHDFIAADSRHYARKVVQDLVDKTDIRDRLPHIGRVVPELGDDNIRELLPYSYRVLYEIKSNDVFVLAVVHQCWTRMLDPDAGPGRCWTRDAGPGHLLDPDTHPDAGPGHPPRNATRFLTDTTDSS